ncbi:uncharacterized protein BP01DRAFT_383262 [Aspergillus saccharolyticus JOP 1030-1]|uniref:Uncharacterized protein n=1 Tax=Aspergillus saccharolyticus JOP 1030-1 TaxID=1450539 RepID=A0A318ZB72_9EURO|nr:hypothetical protein BP01DRAFT_383262 [Aspergillus saccharolyticus JOP 1030-1]PYH44695.1 hypothetical protein BP01DRAFT_383262 [Aspergillus saccharolyticus JOP 1030-1]
MSLTYPPETNSGTVTSYLPLTTAWPSSSGCASYFRLDRPTLVAWDPGYGLDVNHNIACEAPEVTTWWEQGLLGNGGTLPTRVSLGPFTCPEGFATMKSSIKDAYSTLAMCCPSQYYVADDNTALIDGSCESDVSSGMTLTYASTPSGEATKWKIVTTTLTGSWYVGVISVIGWNIQDAVPTATATAAATTTTSAFSSTSPATFAASDSPASSSPTPTFLSETRTLPTGVKVGIGVGARLGLIGAIALLAAWYILRRRKKQQSISASVLPPGQNQTSGEWRTQWPTELDREDLAVRKYRYPAELDGTRHVSVKRDSRDDMEDVDVDVDVYVDGDGDVVGGERIGAAGTTRNDFLARDIFPTPTFLELQRS